MGEEKVYVLGATGFIGSTVQELLNSSHPTGFMECDCLVNCAGFSKMYEGNKNPDAMRKVEDDIFDCIYFIKPKRIIHVSTVYIDVYPKVIYTQIKKEQEERLASSCENTTILRLSNVIGPNMIKGVIFDILHNRPLFVSFASVYNFISVEEVAKLVSHLIINPIKGIINVGSSESISIARAAKILKKNPLYGIKEDKIKIDTSKLQSFYKVKTSQEYIEEFMVNYKGVDCESTV